MSTDLSALRSHTKWRSGAGNRRVELIVTTTLATIAALGVGVMGWNCRRYRLRSDEFARRMNQERQFVYLTHRIMAASDADEVARCIVDGTLHLSSVAGTYVELVLPGGREVEIAARAGEQTPQAGYRAPYRGSVTERAAAERAPTRIDVAGPVDLIAAPLLAGDGPLGALVLVIDPTRRPAIPLALNRVQIVADFAALALKRATLLKEAESRRAEIERHLESKSRLVRGFTHDLKNPIGAIDGYAQILEAGVKGELAPAHREYVRRIRVATRSMLRLIDDLVELARAEAGELRIEPRDVDPTELIGAISDQYRANAAAQGLRLEISIPPSLPQVRTDPDRVRQILGNLLLNAIKYTPAPGRVTVAADTRSPSNVPGEGDWLAISISDTGPGIDQDAQSGIFEEFARISSDNKHGAGLGLAISRHIARAMKGEITVESTPGEGSTFTLWLPLT